MTGALDQQAGERRSDQTGEIAKTVLKGRPLAHRTRPGQSLSEQKYTAAGSSGADARQQQPRKIVVGGGSRAGYQGDCGNKAADCRCPFSNCRSSRPALNQVIAEPAGEKR